MSSSSSPYAIRLIKVSGTALVSGFFALFPSSTFVTGVGELNFGGGGGMVRGGGGIIPLDDGWTSFTGAGIDDTNLVLVCTSHKHTIQRDSPGLVLVDNIKYKINKEKEPLKS